MFSFKHRFTPLYAVIMNFMEFAKVEIKKNLIFILAN